MNRTIKNISGEQLDYILEGNKDSDNIIVFVHGFLSDLNEGYNLFVDISDTLKKDFLCLRFSQSGCGDSEGKQEDYCIEKSVRDLKVILDFCKKEYPQKKLHIIAHSLGNCITSCLGEAISGKTIFTGIPNLDLVDLKDGLLHRMGEPGVELDTSNIIHYKRSSGKTDKVGPDFWKGLANFNFLEALQEYNKISDLYIFKPLEDEVIGNIEKEKLLNIYYKELHGDHNFSKLDDRRELIQQIKKILQDN